MPSEDEEIRLIIDTGDTASGLTRLQRAHLEAAKAASDQARAELLLGKSADATAKTVEAAAAETEAVTRGQVMQYTRLGRVFEDLAKGNVDAAAHMAERFGASFGEIGLAVTAAITIFEVGKSLWKSWAATMDESAKEQIPKVTKAIDDYHEKLHTTNLDLAEHIKLLTQKNQLDKEEAERKAAEKAELGPPQTPGARAKERGATFERMIAGRGEEVIEAVYQHIEATEEPQELKALEDEVRRHPGDQVARNKAIRNYWERAGRFRRRAETMVGKALTGDAAAIEQGIGFGPGFAFADAFRLAGVDEQRAQRAAAADADEQLKRFQEANTQAQARREALDKVSQNIKSETERKNHEMEQEARQRGQLARQLEHEEEQRRHKADTEAHKAETDRAHAEHAAQLAREKAEHDANMAAARRMVSQAYVDRGGLAEGPLNRNLVESMAEDAVQNFQHGVEAWTAAYEAAIKKIETLHRMSQMMLGNPGGDNARSEFPSFASYGWGGG